MNGYLALILTGHVPYLRAAGREPDGEDLLHMTIADALVPTLNALFDLRELGLRPVVALAYSPVLLEQLAVGALAVTRLLGVRPRGLWLPECGYTPALEALLRPSGARYLIVDPSSLPANSIPHLRPRWIASRRLAVLVRDTPASQQVLV